MNVKQLIEELGKMPQDAEVMHLWDGGSRTTIEHIWLAREGVVVMVDYDKLRYWRTPKKP